MTYCQPSVRTPFFLYILAVLALATGSRLEAGDGPDEATRKLPAVLVPLMRQPGIEHPMTRLPSGQTLPWAGADGLMSVSLDGEVSEATLAAVRATGATVTSSTPRWNDMVIRGTLAQIHAAAQLSHVHKVSLVYRPIRRSVIVGTYANQADGVMHTDTLRSTYHTTGAGRTVGVISDTVNATATVGAGRVSGAPPRAMLTGTNPQNAGNLPPSIQVVDFGDSNYQASGGTDEGEGMLEEIYHIAPGAGLAFGVAGNDQSEMANNITLLQTQAGCSVITDDIGYPDEPFFQDGPIAQAANAFVASGGIYTSAAGNDADTGLLRPFSEHNASGTGSHDANHLPLTDDHFTDWGTGVTTPDFLPITFKSGTQVTVIVEWNQPYSRFGLGSGATTDLNLYLYNGPSVSSGIATDPDTGFLLASIDAQALGAPNNGDPLEGFLVSNRNHGDTTLYLACDRYAGSASGLVMRVICMTDGYPIVINAGSTALTGPTMFGHPTALNVLATAAEDFSMPNTVEGYTSLGGWGASGVPFYFGTNGAPLSSAPQLRNKPDITGVDNISTSDFPASGGSFRGTSAAAPNVAAAAELAWTVLGGSNQQVISNLLATATDISAGPASSGPDAWSGHGLVNAFAATGASITGVTTTAPSGTYLGGTIPITVTYSGPITLGSAGSLQLVLNTSQPEVATYASNTSSSITFNYTIAVGDHASPLDATGIRLNGGTITASGSGFPAGIAVPPPGSAGSLSATTPIVVNATPPSLTITGSPVISNQTAFTFTFTFDRPVANFTLAGGKVLLTNGTATGPISGGPTVYTLAVSPTAEGVIQVATTAGAATDATYGYPSLPATGNATYDITPPTLVITSPLPVLENTQDVVITFTFSKVVTNFTSGLITVTGSNGQVFPLVGAGAVYSMKVISGNPGTLTLAVAATTSISDRAGNHLVVPATLSIPVVKGPLPSDTGGSSKCGVGFAGVVILLGLGGFLRRQSRRNLA